jgi:hypothetical protein
MAAAAICLLCGNCEHTNKLREEEIVMELDIADVMFLRDTLGKSYRVKEKGYFLSIEENLQWPYQIQFFLKQLSEYY